MNEEATIEFSIPLRHEDLEEEQVGTYYVMTVIEVASANQSILQNCVTEVKESLEEKAYLIHRHENFDTLYSMLKYVFDTCSGALLFAPFIIVVVVTIVVCEDYNFALL